MKFAIELEEQLAQYYENPKLSENHQSQQKEFDSRAKACWRRKANIERSRRENVTEITLEPIEGLYSDKYELSLDNFSAEGVNLNEEIAVKFFSDAGPKINVLETRRLFKRCLRDHSNLDNLQ